MTRPGCGKFEGNESLEVAEMLYGMDADEFFGTVDEQGWFGVIFNVHLEGTPATDLRHYIVEEDSDGFFMYTEYKDIQQAREYWERTVDNLSPLSGER